MAEEISPSPSVHDDTNQSTTETITETNDYEGSIRPDVETALVEYWTTIIGTEFDIIVAQISKFKEGGGLGISLEGTVEKVDGEEQNPHHYIRQS